MSKMVNIILLWRYVEGPCPYLLIHPRFKLSLVWYLFSFWFLEIKLINSFLPVRFFVLLSLFLEYGKNSNHFGKMKTCTKIARKQT